jgi:methionyl aminopeptidase
MRSSKILIKSKEEIELIKQSCKLVSKTLAFLSQNLQPGISTLKLDSLAEEFIRDHNAIPAFKNYKPDSDHNPYPYTLCTSLNDEVVHGMPSAKTILKEGDILSIDCGVWFNGYYGDSAYTYAVGQVSPEKMKLLQVTYDALYKGIHYAKEGNRVGDISYAIQTHVESNGFSVVKEMGGHGIGKSLHEPPQVPNFGIKGKGLTLKEGMVLAIEPIVNYGLASIYRKNDGWTIVTKDKSISAHYEHTVLVKKHEAEILTSFEFKN